MEERLIDKEDERLIRIKKRADETDAEDALAPEGEEADESAEGEEEVLVTLPEADEDYDEDMVGLTASELAKVMARRKKEEEEAKAEYDKLVAAADEALANGDYEQAAPLYEQAACYPFADEKVFEGLWTARTQNFTQTAPFYNDEYAEEIGGSDALKAFIRDKAGEALRQERDTMQKEEAELAPEVLEKQEERRQAFVGNRKYYGLRLVIFAGLMVLFAIAAIVSSTYIVRTLTMTPVILTSVFGGLTLISFIASLVFLLKYAGASKLCRMNDKLASTDEGARLEELRAKLECLKLILED